jgi:hypothetical protein
MSPRIDKPERASEVAFPSRDAVAFRTVQARNSALTRARQRLFRIDAAESLFARRRFAPAEPARQERLEQIGAVFITGYNAAVRAADPITIVGELKSIPNELIGFAFEGAAMGFALLDLVLPWRSRLFDRFLTRVAAPHAYMAHVGAGWALARTSPRLIWRLGKLDPLLRWLMFDGYGFHEGYFHHDQWFDPRRSPKALRGYARNVFDQGLGRALWFVKGADPPAVAAAVLDFPEQRRADLWSGIGLACTYAGGVDADGLNALTAASGTHHACLGQGAAFAAKARERAGNPAPHTELACQTICGMGAAAVAAIADQTLPAVTRVDCGEAYRRWRFEISRRL